MDFLKRDRAPITSSAWEEIDDRAVEILKAQLYARRFVDIEGPFGWSYSSHSLGKLHVFEDKKDDPRWGIRQVLPMIETRIPFELGIWLLDDIERGDKTPDLEPLENAVKKAAEFEDSVVFNGLEQAKVTGVLSEASKSAVSVSFEDLGSFFSGLSRATTVFSSEGVEGPYALIVNSEIWAKMHAKKTGGQPLGNHISSIIGGPVIKTGRIDEGFLVSMRGGDFSLILGQDFSIGYESHTAESVRLFIAESFTFQIVSPEALVGLKG
ncbi:MAG: bacteriocin protein [Thermotogales bacterium 46_20]|nr:MAG: bacteriocin protein [Thermotogales bacterium 46_20]